MMKWREKGMIWYEGKMVRPPYKSVYDDDGEDGDDDNDDGDDDDDDECNGRN